MVDASGQLITIPAEHSKVHQGKMFSAGYYDSAVLNTNAINLLIQVPATHQVHVYIKILSGGDALFTFYNGTTFSAAGTAITPVNHNFGSTNTANATITHTPTITDVGAQKWEEYIPGGSGSGAGATPGAVQNIATEQAVLTEGDYLFRLTNNAGSTQPLQIMVAFYEVPE